MASSHQFQISWLLTRRPLGDAHLRLYQLAPKPTKEQRKNYDNCSCWAQRRREAAVAAAIRINGERKFMFTGFGRQWPRRSHEIIIVKAVEKDARGLPDGSLNVGRVAHLVVSLGIILAIDKALKRVFTAAMIKFPSSLFGMFCIFSVLSILDVIRPAAATALLNFFEPATTFIQRWLPLFYVPSLVVLPLAVKGIPASSGMKIGAILVGGWAASLYVAGYTAIAVRKMVRTEMIAAEPMPKPSPFSRREIWFWTIILSVSFILTVLSPLAFGTYARTCLPFLLAATALGFILGSGFPPTAKKLLHPIITCALSADLAAFACGTSTGLGFESTLGAYLTKSATNPGAGDILMGFLGSVILSFAFSMFRQRKLVKRHAAEIFSAVVASTIFSLYSTAAMGRVIGLEPTLTVSILPRCITVALALSIVSLFDGRFFLPLPLYI